MVLTFVVLSFERVRCQILVIAMENGQPVRFVFNSNLADPAHASTHGEDLCARVFLGIGDAHATCGFVFVQLALTALPLKSSCFNR